MSDPIADGPPPAAQQVLTSDAAFEPGPTAPDLCGFELPTLRFRFGFKLPAIAFPPRRPSFLPSLGIDCTKINPLDPAGNKPDGGGRVGTSDEDPDLQLDQTSP